MRGSDEAGVPVWALLGRRAGDNRQLLALAEEIGLPFAMKQLVFNWRSSLPNLLLGSTRNSVRPSERAALVAPWPKLVLSSGKRSAPAALWIRRASGGAAKIVHLGRPWAPLDRFDLIITTPQYGLPRRANIVINAMPLGRPPALAAIPDDLAALPRPRLMAIVGGPSSPLALDAGTVRAMVQKAAERSARAGGSLLIATSPRTPPAAVAAAKDAALEIGAAGRLSVYGETPSQWRGFLAAADSFMVTEDSATMASEAAMLGKPVSIQMLPRRPDFARLLADALKNGPARPLFKTLRDLGLATATRDMPAFMDRLQRDGLLSGGPLARMTAELELARAARLSLELAGARRRAPGAVPLRPDRPVERQTASGDCVAGVDDQPGVRDDRGVVNGIMVG